MLTHTIQGSESAAVERNGKLQQEQTNKQLKKKTYIENKLDKVLMVSKYKDLIHFTWVTMTTKQYV